jgi:ribosomal-protein-alanine N-acetyltransferase
METETARLRLRPFVPGDFEELFRLYSDPEVMRYIGQGVRTPEETEQGLNRGLGHWRDRGFGMWAAYDKASGKFVGRCGIQPLHDTGQVELGYALHQEFWGRGLATEASLAALRFGFHTIGLERIVAIARPENMASRHVMEKVGMTYERTGPSPYGLHDVVWYGLSRPDYERQLSNKQSPGVRPDES